MYACTGISGQQIFINIPLFTFINALLSLKYYAPDTRSSVNMTWRYCTCICKLLMFRCFRSVQMLHNVKKNNIDLFEVHVHVSSFLIHVHVQLQFNLNCTDARPQIIWSYMRALSEHQIIERKDRFVIGSFKYTCIWRESVPALATPILLKKTRCWYHLTFITQIVV